MTILAFRLNSIFSNLFPKRRHVLDALKKHIHENGFDEAFPLVVGYGPWTEHDLLLDGHCRRQVCEELGIEKVPVVRRFFESEDEAIEYMIHVQKDRRNLTDAEILNCVAILDRRKEPSFRGNQYGCGEAQRCASPDDGKSAKRTADTLGIGARKVEQVRTVIEHADEELKRAISTGKKSINKAYQETQSRRKMEETQKEPQQEDSVETEEIIHEVQEEDVDHEKIHDSSSEEDHLDKHVMKLECWVADTTSRFDSDSIDYMIVGQGTPPASASENQQVFVAPWMATPQGKSIGPAEDMADQEASTPTPLPKPNVVNVENYDAEGWYALEQEWAKFIPGLVPDPPEGIEVATGIEEPHAVGDAASGNDEPSPQSEVQGVDPALEKLATSLEMGHGEWTRLEKWAKRYGVIVYTLSDNRRKVDRRKFFALVQSVKGLNDILKGPVKPEYAWFPETFHRICLENGHNVSAPDCGDGFEVNLLLDHLCFKGVYSGGSHHPQNEESITRKLAFLIENWTEVCTDVKKYGFIQDRSDSPSFDWVVRYGENIFDCVHHKMQAIARVQLEQIFGNAGIALS